jgi:competence protein ComEA
VRLSSRRSDDADVIRARLRALLAEGVSSRGWLPDELDDDPGPGSADSAWAWAAEDEEDTRRTSPVGEPEAESLLPGGIGRHRAPGRATRWDPGRPGARALWAAGLVAALVLVGWTWLDRPRVDATLPAEPTAPAATAAPQTSRAPATPPVGEVAETAGTVVVSVVGLVASPGLVTLPSGARVADAVQAAGGLLPGTDPASVNLAAVVTDGQQIAVGVPGAGGGGAARGPGAASASGGKVDLNRATAGDLDALPGIGPVLAARIVDYRDANGPFRSVDQLDDVPGIGPSIFADLAERVTV